MKTPGKQHQGWEVWVGAASEISVFSVRLPFRRGEQKAVSAIFMSSYWYGRGVPWGQALVLGSRRADLVLCLLRGTQLG